MRTLSLTVAAGAATLAAIGVASPAWAVAKTVYASGVTAPGGALWLKDQTTVGGHLWVSDHLNGLCRLDPVDATGVTATLNTGSCLVFGATTQPAYDPVGKWVYIPDISRPALGVRKVAFNPATGLLNRLKQSTLAAPLDGRGRGLRLTAAAVDSKGNLYIGGRADGTIYRYAAASHAAGAAGAAQPVASTEDGAPVLSLAFGKTVVVTDPTTVPPTTATTDDLYAAGTTVMVRPDLYGVDPGLGLDPCTPAALCTAVDPGLGIFGPQSVAYDGKYVYAGDVSTLYRINPVDLTKVSYATGFANLSAIAVSDQVRNATTGAVTARKVFGGDDPTAGAAIGLGHVYRMNRQP